jgi:hypothetical protein
MGFGHSFDTVEWGEPLSRNSTLEGVQLGDLESKPRRFENKRANLALSMVRLVHLGPLVDEFHSVAEHAVDEPSFAAMALIATGGPNLVLNRRNYAPR